MLTKPEAPPPAAEPPRLPRALRDLLLTLAHDLRHAAALLADHAGDAARRRAGGRRLPRRKPGG